MIMTGDGRKNSETPVETMRHRASEPTPACVNSFIDPPQAIAGALAPLALKTQRGIPYMTRFPGVKSSGRQVFWRRQRGECANELGGARWRIRLDQDNLLIY